MSVIRLTKTPEFERILNEIRVFYPLLDDVALIKMMVSKFYSSHQHLPVTHLTPEEEKGVIEGRRDIAEGRYVVAPGDQPIDLDKIINEF